MKTSGERPLTYLSLFSSAGVGCYGFSMEGFQCVATNELLERRLAVQKVNGKCKYETGYVAGDIQTESVKNQIFTEIARWRSDEGVNDIDVLIATPPCQGMSVANHKKTENEINRNSLIVESIKLVSEISPKVFVFENVPRFLRTICTDADGMERPIEMAISRGLGKSYSIYSRVINFKDYGACSSRTRTLVIGVRRDWADYFSPIELFPSAHPEVTLRECIGDMPSLRDFGEFDPTDFYHNFRPYQPHMRKWICDIIEGESAFDNAAATRRPHQVINGRLVPNQQKNGDKYRRQYWDKVGPCVHTRNDQLASQNTIHPCDDRVFSIRELMRLMTIPDCFKWVDADLTSLNGLSVDQKRALLKKHEINIRQSLGEAVPTSIFRSIAQNLKSALTCNYLTDREIRSEVESLRLYDPKRVREYIFSNPRGLGYASLSRIVELTNANRNTAEAYFTNKTLATEIFQAIPELPGGEIRVLEPSVGAGNFLPLLFRMLSTKTKVTLTVNDIDTEALATLQALMNTLDVPENVRIDYQCGDFLLTDYAERFDLVIGNPPFAKVGAGPQLRNYRTRSQNRQASNTSAFFLEKALSIGNYVAFVMPKFLLNTPEYAVTRELLSRNRIDAIIDFGELGFSGVLIETVAIAVDTDARPGKTYVKSVPHNEICTVNQGYISDGRFPYWLIYRNSDFDRLANKMIFGIFEVFRDRQLTNSLLTDDDHAIRVIKSRNICEHGTGVIDIPGYDSFVQPEVAKGLAVNKFINDDGVYLAPNMTYKPRVVRKPPGTLVNGSAAILTLKEGQPHLTDQELKFFASQEYREFYQIARNRQTRSLNIDKSSVFFFGKLLDHGDAR